MAEVDIHNLDKDVAVLKAQREGDKLALSLAREGDKVALTLALDTVKDAASNSFSVVSLIVSIISMLLAAYVIFSHK